MSGVSRLPPIVLHEQIVDCTTCGGDCLPTSEHSVEFLIIDGLDRTLELAPITRRPGPEYVDNDVPPTRSCACDLRVSGVFSFTQNMSRTPDEVAHESLRDLKPDLVRYPGRIDHAQPPTILTGGSNAAVRCTPAYV